MEYFFLFIKHRLSFLWKIIEWINGLLFSFFFNSRVEILLPLVFKEFTHPLYSFRRLDESDIADLHELCMTQRSSDLEYFSPHRFDLESLKMVLKNRAFLMMGAFDGEKLVGYFFLRFFVNKRCFVGRLIDRSYRSKSIGSAMNNILYETAWRMGFRCLSTISKNNRAIMRAHSKNNSMIVQKELKNDYLLVEFKRFENVSKTSV